DRPSLRRVAGSAPVVRRRPGRQGDDILVAGLDGFASRAGFFAGFLCSRDVRNVSRHALIPAHLTSIAPLSVSTSVAAMFESQPITASKDIGLRVKGLSHWRSRWCVMTSIPQRRVAGF